MTLINYHCLEMTIYEYAKKIRPHCYTVTDGSQMNYNAIVA